MTKMGLQIAQQLTVCLCFLSICAIAQITIQPLSNMVVNNGDDVVIDCIVRNLQQSDNIVFLIIHGESNTAVVVNDILATINPRYEFQSGSTPFGHWRLTIRNAKIEDQGTWSCKLQIPTSVSKEMNLLVLTPPSITEITQDLAPIVGSTVILWCNATGSPDPTIKWSRLRPRTAQPYITGSMFVLPNIQTSSRGLYECRASNGIGASVAMDDVFLQMEHSPIVTVDKELVTAPLGDPVSLKCVCEAYPAITTVPAVTWELDDYEVDTSDGYQISIALDTGLDPYRETSVSTLVITSVTKASMGRYTCRFQNTKGTAEKTIDLEEGIRIDPDKGKSTSSAPQVINALTTIMAAVTTATTLMQH